MSTYDRDYPPKKAIPNKCAFHSEQKRGDQPNLDPLTTYFHDYP
jgi:hypothetical protein